MSATNIDTLTHAAGNLVAAGDGRLFAILSRSIRHVRAEFPGLYKQIGQSKTVKAQIDKLIWEHVKPRATRFLTNNKINLKLV